MRMNPEPRGDPNARPSDAYAVLPSAPRGPSFAGPPARGWLVDKSVRTLLPTSQPRAGAGGCTCLKGTMCGSMCEWKCELCMSASVCVRAMRERVGMRKIYACEGEGGLAVVAIGCSGMLQLAPASLRCPGKLRLAPAALRCSVKLWPAPAALRCSIKLWLALAALRFSGQHKLKQAAAGRSGRQGGPRARAGRLPPPPRRGRTAQPTSP